MKRINIRMSPPRVLTLSFIMLSIIGTCLLKLPIATTTSISWLDALFTTVSACTVTGLGVVDTESIYLILPMCHHFNTYTSGRTWHYELCRFNCDYAWQKNLLSKPNFTATSIKSNEYRRCHSSCQSIIFILFYSRMYRCFHSFF